MVVLSLADIAGASASVPLSATPIAAKWVQLVNDAASGGTIRIGGGEVTSSRGLPLAAGASMFYPVVSEVEFYQLAQLSAYVPSGSTLHVLYGF